jgi:3-methyladenine DNA glycosylase/8-oxoguanine DNA glycosylase
MLVAGSVPGAESSDTSAGEHTRLLQLAEKGSIAVTVALHRDHVTIRHDPVGPDNAAEIVRQVRRWLDLDVDHLRIRDALGADPVIGSMITARPGLRVIGYPDGFEAAVLTVLGQQVSLGAGRTFGGRAVAAFGLPGPAGLLVFPTPQVLAAADPVQLQARIGITGSRARTLHALATACADGLRIEADGDCAAIRRDLLALPGIGPWTVDIIAVRGLGDRDAFPAGDLVVRRALGVSTPAAATAAAVRWSPYRAYALFHLWSAALGI